LATKKLINEDYGTGNARWDEAREPKAMLNCRQVTRLVSRSMDAQLPWHQRLGIRLHLMYCVWCRRYAAQLRFLRTAAKHSPAELEVVPPHALSSEAKDQIRVRLHEALKKPSPPAS